MGGADGSRLSEEQQALDDAAAADAGMGTTEVSTLGTFGLRPSEMDPEAASAWRSASSECRP